MRIVFYTSEGYERTPLFLYQYAHVKDSWNDVHIVAVRSSRESLELRKWFRRRWKKIGRLGFLRTIEILSSYPLARRFITKNGKAIDALLSALPRPDFRPDSRKIQLVDSLNGPDAVKTLTALAPDIIIQSGAGILRPCVFQIPRIGTLNMHHGIAPLIKGMSSIYWALWERKPEWIGTTIHWIDQGIDTGGILAYGKVVGRAKGEGFAPLFVRATEAGVARLKEVLVRLANGEEWAVEPPDGERVYRSTISGWRMLIIRRRLARELAE